MSRLRYLYSTTLALGALSALTLVGCASNRAAFYHQEEFTDTSAFSRSFPGSEKAVCEAARRALLGQGYIISKSTANTLDGTKSFQPSADKHMELAFHVVCASNGKSSTMFVSATQDGFALKKTGQSASVGVGVLGSVSMPFTSSDDSLVRVTSETIRSGDFYDRFFAASERYLIVDTQDDADAPAKK